MNFKKLLTVSLLTLGLTACSCGNKIPQSDISTGDSISPSMDMSMVESKLFKGKVSDRVFFSTNRSDLNSESQDTLREQAAILKGRSNTVVVEGHCDDRGTREYNLALGERRANAAKEFLVQQGLENSRVSTVSYGKERPEVMGATPEAWAQNRRAVTVVNE